MRDVDDGQAAVGVGRRAAEGEGCGRGERADEPGLDEDGVFTEEPLVRSDVASAIEFADAPTLSAMSGRAHLIA